MFERYPSTSVPITARLARPGDMNDLSSMDLKCYHYKYSTDTWRELLKAVGPESKVLIAFQGVKPVGYCCWEKIIDDNTDEEFISVTRMGCHPAHRRKGVASRLVESIKGSAVALRVNTLCTVVPEIHCVPGDPDDVSEFLKRVGFSTTGAITYEFQKMYGDMVDGYHWAMRL